MFRRGNYDIQNTNFLPSLIYTLEVEVNLLDFNSKYPKDPQTLGERIRKSRMDKALMIEGLAEMIGVTEDAVINWETRNIKPEGRNIESLKALLGELGLKVVKLEL